MHAGLVANRPMCHSAYFEDLRLPRICPTRKSEPGSAQLPRLKELPNATWPTVSGVSCRRITCCLPSPTPHSRCSPRPRQAIMYTRHNTIRNCPPARLREPLHLNAADCPDLRIRSQREPPVFRAQYQALVQKPHTTRAPWSIALHKSPHKRHRLRVKVETAHSALLSRQQSLEATAKVRGAINDLFCLQANVLLGISFESYRITGGQYVTATTPTE
ncbi:hypothetical protein CH063_11718 [Colletotrichum higginsianum]|uniref:Uncharacterized protein n=1 Tax=Colletotrichum higginsianum (strain IMI 349063) TaxID=759273 RepID=H1VMJ5_COLHI|nr:hypothetical protein CH063_11718 [Colletotrichum higginsianum]